jgi:mono/diheme cytochrome c family protein
MSGSRRPPQLSDAQIAALTNYVTTQFANPAATRVSETDVAKLR